MRLRTGDDAMSIRIIKRLPAPMMDGFNVAGFHPDHVYAVDVRLATYLIAEGYACAAPSTAHKHGRHSRTPT